MSWSARYVMREKFFAFGHDFVVKDDAGAHFLTIHNKLLSIRNTLVLHDPDGAVLGRAVKRLLSVRECWDLYRGEGDEVAGVLTKHFLSLRPSFTLEVPGEPDVQITGSFLEHDYRFESAGHTQALVSKRWLTVQDSYGIEVMKGADDFLVVATVAVLDVIHHEEIEAHRHL